MSYEKHAKAYLEQQLLLKSATERLKVKNELPTHVKVHGDIRCRCCGLTATKKIVKDTYPSYNNPLGYKLEHYIPDLNGWMVIDYPFIDPRHEQRDAGAIPKSMQFKEKSKVCPKCAKTVMGTLVYLSKP